MRRTSTFLVLSAALCGLVACGGGGTTNPPPADTGVPTDTGNPTDRVTPTDTVNPTDTGNPTDTVNHTDRVTPVDVVTDGGNPTDTPVVTDTPTPTDRVTPPVDAGPPYDPCAMGSVIDLNAMGMLMGATTRITSNNNMVGAMAPLRGPCGSPGHEVVFRYSPRANTRLRISTDNMGTLATLDTVVWAQTTCASLAAGMGGLGCSDDNGSMTRRNTSAFTTNVSVMMGAPIFIVVAGYTPPVTGFVPQGAFELSVTELTEVAVGMPCDGGVTNFCAMGASCVGATGMQRCVADGASGGRCRTAMGTMPCDMGLACSIGVCAPSIAVGMPCGGTVVGVCATGSSCAGPTGMRRCVADGAAGGNCRTGSMCDTGLTCRFGTCIRTVAVGGACDPADVGQVCAMDTTCAPMGSTAMTTCQMNGTAAGTPCRTTAMRCDTGLDCSAGATGTGVCQRAATVGAACDLRFDSTRCAMGSACAPTSATAATCRMATPETEPNNSATMPQAAITASTVFSGAVGAMGDPMDCYAVTVPAMGQIYVETQVPGSARCSGNDTYVTLFNSMGTEVTHNDDGRGLCSVINPATDSAARGLAAGNYSVCVRAFSASTTIMSYLVAIGVYGP